MTEYASLTVASLKELLKGKGLPVDGKKADLVARLTEADGASGELDEPEAEEKPEAEPEAAAETKEDAAEAPEEAPAPAAEPEKKEPKKTLTPEERKQMAVDLLTKKIKRAEKFGDDALAQAAKKDLARVEKFGVDPSTALAKEIGSLHREVNSELGIKPKKKGGKKKN